MGFRLQAVGKWTATERFLNRLQRKDYFSRLNEYAQQGVSALQAATPVDSGRTASAWRYEIEANGDTTSIYWINDNTTYQGDPIAILLQYGHGTGTGGYVRGRDYINPAMRPVFDKIEEGVWQLVIGG